MAVTRRGFFGVLGVTGVVGAVASAPVNAEADELTYRGWRVRWSGWREPANQMLTIGYWSAERPGGDEVIAATSTGNVGGYRPGYTLDFSLERGWTPLYPWTKPEALFAARNRALALLKDDLNRR